MRQRFYVNGKLTKSSAGEPAKLRKWLDNMERDWSAHGLFPLTEPGQFDFNRAHEVTRTSLDELNITTTSGKQLRVINVEERREGLPTTDV